MQFHNVIIKYFEFEFEFEFVSLRRLTFNGWQSRAMHGHL